MEMAVASIDEVCSIKVARRRILDWIGTERFGEASRKNNGPLKKKDQKSVGERTIFLGTR
jgi:hypothetical protein